MNFYYNQETIHFVSNWDIALMDRYRYTMRSAAKSAGHDVMVPAEDLARIYSPAMELYKVGDLVRLSMNGRTVTLRAGEPVMTVQSASVRLINKCFIEDGLFYLPVGEVMHFGFGKLVRSSGDMSPTYISQEARRTYSTGGEWPQENTVIAVSEDEHYQIDGQLLRYIRLIQRGKVYGEQYRTYWMEKPRKVLPYITYIPTSYTPEKPSKMVVFLHGGSVDIGEKYAFQFSGNKLQKACEAYNYILLCPNACTLLNRYGNLSPQERAEMPLAEQEYFQLGDDSVMQAIREVKKEYNIDESHIYLMGNSMGAGGVFYLPTVHPGMFRALAPGAGSLVLMQPDHLENLRATPIIYPAGTEDDFGFDNILRSRDMLLAAGVEVEMAIVGGGRHLDAWVDVIDDIFTFFEKHS